MKIIANDIKNGHTLEYEGKLWIVLKTAHTQPGKGGAFVQVEMKDIRSGIKKCIRFRSQESVERARIEQKEYQYSYSEMENIVLIDQETWEQILIPKDMLLEDNIRFLCEGMILTVDSYNDENIALHLPEQVDVVVAECEPALKGQTVSSSFKPAILENGAKLTVPPFIEAGDNILINTCTMEYIERVKK